MMSAASIEQPSFFLWSKTGLSVLFSQEFDFYATVNYMMVLIRLYTLLLSNNEHPLFLNVLSMGLFV